MNTVTAVTHLEEYIAKWRELGDTTADNALRALRSLEYDANELRAALEESLALDTGKGVEDIKAWQASRFHEARRIAKSAINQEDAA